MKSLFDKVAVLQPSNFIKERLQHGYFPVNVAKFLKTHILKNIFEWLLLLIVTFAWIYLGRSSRPDVFCKKGVLRNITKLTGKHLCQSIFFNKVAGLCKKRGVFSEFCEMSNNTIFYITPLVTASVWINIA